jgi:tRNA G10  N-methylase Trm11
MDMKKILMVLALSLPLMAQQVEVKEVDGNTEVTVKKQHDKKGGWKRGDGRKMEQRKKRSHMRKKRAIRSVVRIIVVGGVAYYIGYHKGQHNKHPMKRKPYMGDRK